MDTYILLLIGLGIVVLGIAWLPMLLRGLPLSVPIFCVVVGYALFAVPGTGVPPDFERFPAFTERLTELVVIISLMGAGLKIDRPVGWRRWMTAWRLLAVSMPLSILGLALLGWWLLDLSPAAAVLLGALLAPTDPVLASDVQVGPPRSGGEDEVRFSLTAEAGLNDGLAFPFVNLAIAMAAYGVLPGAWTVEWLVVDVVWKLAAGVGVGMAVGHLLGFLVFRLPENRRLADTREGLAVLGFTVIAYGVTELAHGYGFLAVFVAAVTLRLQERSHDYNEDLHRFSEQVEKLLTMAVLMLFGGALAGGLLEPLTWAGAGVGLLFLLVVRPLSGLAGLIGTRTSGTERAVIAVFGIRGIGSLYYIAYAVNHGSFADEEVVWAVTGFVIAASVLLHGMTVTPVMNRLEDQFSRPFGSEGGPSVRSPPPPSREGG